MKKFQKHLDNIDIICTFATVYNAYNENDEDYYYQELSQHDDTQADGDARGGTDNSGRGVRRAVQTAARRLSVGGGAPDVRRHGRPAASLYQGHPQGVLHVSDGEQEQAAHHESLQRTGAARGEQPRWFRGGRSRP